MSAACPPGPVLSDGAVLLQMNPTSLECLSNRRLKLITIGTEITFPTTVRGSFPFVGY